MEDTIAAVATPYGEGGIGIIRVSGNKAGSILNMIFRPLKYQNATQIENRRLVYGHIVDSKTDIVVDEVLAVFMKAPHTYTAEDVAEIHCHGGSVPLRRTLDLCLSAGARLAEKGEFTKRAFLNGRIDLSQAEAVIDLIRAKTDLSFDAAMSQAEGYLSQKIRKIRENLMDLLVQLAVNIDYPDEDIEVLTLQETEKSILQIYDKLEKLRSTADAGRILREGLRIAIVGKPNVGKSSLMNALLRESRAIVTEIPGTTRDTIEEGFDLRGIPVQLTDTAGIRETEDPVEKIGVERSKDAFNQADLVLFMLDTSRTFDREDNDILEQIGNKKVLFLLNKTDLPRKFDWVEIEKRLPGAEKTELSLKEETGISLLEDKITEWIFGGRVKREESGMVTNLRHIKLLEQARDALSDAKTAAEQREALDLVEIDVRRAWEFLGEIIGETAADDVIDKVFERFCLGK